MLLPSIDRDREKSLLKCPFRRKLENTKQARGNKVEGWSREKERESEGIKKDRQRQLRGERGREGRGSSRKVANDFACVLCKNANQNGTRRRQSKATSSNCNR